jgi:putative ABC transport system permease protein
MLRNYFTIAFRNLLRHKGFSFINVFGLSVGLACCLLIVFYVLDELSYDRFHAHGDRIVRVVMHYGFGDQTGETANTGTKVAPAFSRDFPEVEQAVRVYDRPAVVKYEDKLFEEKRFFYADSTFFRIFSFGLLEGDPATVLKGPNKVVLTQAMARKYFGQESPLGQVLRINDNQDYLVTGVAADVPANSQIKFDFVASFSSLAASREEQWFSANYKTYLLLHDPAAISSLQAKIPGYMEKQMGEDAGGFLTYELEPLHRVHLHSQHAGFEPNADIRYVYIFSIIALLILVIACTNYMNLTTARAAERAKEVGVRKVMGALRKQLFWQFLGESVIITFAALLLSVLLVELLLPFFNNLTGRTLEVELLQRPGLLLGLLATGLVVSLLAGSYPSVVLSAFRPVKVLKGSFQASASGLWLRKGLIVLQFAISTFLIIGTLIIQRQLHYLQTKKLGYNNEHVLVLPGDRKIFEKLSTLKTELKQNPNIKEVTAAYDTPTIVGWTDGLRVEGMAENENKLVNAMPVERDFVKTLELELVAGTDFTAADEQQSKLPEEEATHGVLLNEAAVRELGWTPAEAIGKKVLGPREGYVRGVVQDFHFAPLHVSITPMVIFMENMNWRKVMVKTSGEELASTLAYVEEIWRAQVPHRPFVYDFLDQEYANLYQAERRTGRIFGTFAFLAVMLACLGLFGLAAFMAQQRTKEIGIRKVLGASVASIVGLLSQDFVKLVGVAFAIAAPLAWYAMRRWLEDFTYRVDLEWWVFAAAGGAAVLIALLTVSFQSIKVALRNPIKSLRSE